MHLPSGGELHVSGPEGGVPLLFLHGVGGGAWSWRAQRERFEHQYRVYLWEARGHGSARRVADAGLADYYTDAREALDAVGRESGAPAIVAGHSMGGLLAVALACDEPARVARLFLIDPVYATDAAYGHFSPRAGRIALWLCEPLVSSFERDGRLSRRLSRWMFEHSFENRERMEAAWVDQRRQVPVEYQRMLRESFGVPTGFTLRDFASEIACPTFLLEGSAGRARPRFTALAATLERRLGDAFEREWIRGGHYLQADEPEAVNLRLARFCASARGARPAAEPV